MKSWQCSLRKGHKAFAPTIAGHGKGVHKNVNHAQCTKSVVDYIVDKPLSDIVLLGHSFGGTIISKVAELIPQRIRRLVFLNAFVLQDGKSLNDEVPKVYVDLFDPIREGVRILGHRAIRGTLVPRPVLGWCWIDDAFLGLRPSLPSLCRRSLADAEADFGSYNGFSVRRLPRTMGAR